MKKKKQIQKYNFNDQTYRDLCLFRDRGDIAITTLQKILRHSCWVSKIIARKGMKDIEKFTNKYF